MNSNRTQKLFKNPFPFPLLPLLLLAGIFYVNFSSRIIFSPLLPVIQADLGMGYAKAGSLFLLAALGYSLGSLGSGFITAFLSYRHALLFIAGITGVAMLWMSQTSSAAGLYSGLILLGISGGLYTPSGIGFLTNLIPKEHWGKAIGVHELAPNIGFISAPLIAVATLSFSSWRATLALMGVWSLVMGGIFYFFSREGKEHGHPPNFHAVRQIFSHPSFWFMTALFTIALGVNLGVYNMTPLFLVRERGMSLDAANNITGFSRVAGFLMGFLAGWLVDRTGLKAAMLLCLATSGLLTILLSLFHGPFITPLLVFLQASSVVCFFPVGYTALSMIFSDSTRNLAVSMVLLFSYLLGVGVFPVGIGLIAEKLSFSWSFLFIGILTLSALPLVFRRMPEKAINQG